MFDSPCRYCVRGVTLKITLYLLRVIIKFLRSDRVLRLATLLNSQIFSMISNTFRQNIKNAVS